MRTFSRPLKKVVIKIGSSSITHPNGGVNIERIDALAKEIANLQNQGIAVILVSSGAIAAGSHRLMMPSRPTEISEQQASAAVGQVILMNTYLRAFSEYGYSVAQLLLTRLVEDNHEMHANAQNTLARLMQMKTLPIVNENDTISTFEIKFGDNDTLSAVVARLIDADLLILLSDIDGMYTDDPHLNANAQLIEEVHEINASLQEMGKGSVSSVGTGGMVTKLNAAKLCMDQGIDVVLTNSKDLTCIRRIVKGESIGTIFKK